MIVNENDTAKTEELYQLVSSGNTEEFDLLARLEFLDKRLDKINSFLGTEDQYVIDRNSKGLLEEIDNFYNLAALLDTNGLVELEQKLTFLDSDVDNVTKEKRMKHLNKEQKEEVRHEPPSAYFLA
jgi:ABC-type transporter Mla subunit MlaD